MTAIRRFGRGLLLCASLAACGGDTQVHHASISLAELTNPRTGKRSLSGFACTEAATDTNKTVSRALLRRATKVTADEVVLQATIVVDSIRLDGYPGCQLSEIANFCSSADQTCAPIPQERRCFDLEPLHVPAATEATRLQALAGLGATFADYVRSGLSGQVLTDDALDQEVLIRAVGTTQTCAELEATAKLEFASEDLLGCTYSCPLVLAAARGEIVLDSAASGHCEDQIIACASPAFAPLSLDTALPASF